MKINLFIPIRILIGGMLVFSSLQKLLGPHQNFLVIVQNYELFGPAVNEFIHFLDNIISRTLPWIELFLGLFLVLGLWLKETLHVALGLFGLFLVVISQALIRQLPITECGCFGENFSLPIQSMLLLDLTTFVLIILLMKKKAQCSKWSLDEYFEK